MATSLATMVAILIAHYRFRGKQLLLSLSVLPLIVPYIVLGIASLCSSCPDYSSIPVGEPSHDRCSITMKGHSPHFLMSPTETSAGETEKASPALG